MKEKRIYRQQGKDPLYKIWHSSEEHLFMYFHSDGGNIVCTDQNFPIKKGSLVFIAANTYHYTMPDDPDKYERSKLWISQNEFNKISDLLNDNKEFKNLLDKAIVYSEIEENAQKEIDRIFNELSTCHMDNEREVMLFSCCLKLLLYLNKYSKEHTPLLTVPMEKAIDYINKNISSDINIDNICSAIGFSKYYFCRQFKKHTGMTVMKYILKTRIVLAKIELKKTTLSINEISEQFGFSSVSYFSRIFKEEEGCSPLQYRKRYHIQKTQ